MENDQLQGLKHETTGIVTLHTCSSKNQERTCNLGVYLVCGVSDLPWCEPTAVVNDSDILLKPVQITFEMTEDTCETAEWCGVSFFVSESKLWQLRLNFTKNQSLLLTQSSAAYNVSGTRFFLFVCNVQAATMRETPHFPHYHPCFFRNLCFCSLSISHP